MANKQIINFGLGYHSTLTNFAISEQIFRILGKMEMIITPVAQLRS